MRRFFRYRPSPATIIAACVSSLVFAGIAAANLPGSNSVISSDIAPRAVHNSDTATGAVNSRTIRNGSIALGDLSSATIAALKGAAGGPGAPGTPGATGPTGPAGGGATTGGSGAAKFVYHASSNTGNVDVVNVGGIRATASCDASGNIHVDWRSAVDDSRFVNSSYSFTDVDFDTGVVHTSNGDSGWASVVYSTPAGSVVNLIFDQADLATGGAPGPYDGAFSCSMVGFAIAA